MTRVVEVALAVPGKKARAAKNTNKKTPAIS
jgi:hypothetical protein